MKLFYNYPLKNFIVLLSLIILLVIPISSFAQEEEIICEAEICVEECLLMPNCTVIWEPEPYNPLTIQLDKSTYYLNDIISINGTINGVDWSNDTTVTYDIIHENNIIQTGDGGILQDDGTFNFTINTDNWDYNGYFKVIVSIQGYEGIDYFYYYNTVDITNEALYDYILTNDSTIAIHTDILAEHGYLFDSYNDSIDIFNSTLNIQQLQIYDLQNQLELLGGYLININVTLGEYPPFLNVNATNSINNEIQRLRDDIFIRDSSIIDDLILLRNATDNNEPVRIEILTNSIGSSILTREISQSNLNMIYLYLDIYPQ